MPTTSNFGWTTPADTDLVKDGAAAIRTLGNGIDTSFLDLKGGTTGQVLAKASNTDLDFTFTTVSSEGFSLISTITASAATTVNFTSIPTNYRILKVVWNEVVQSAAGYWNPRINNDSNNDYKTVGFRSTSNTAFTMTSATDSIAGISLASGAVIPEGTTGLNIDGWAGVFEIANANQAVPHTYTWYSAGWNAAGSYRHISNGSGYYKPVTPAAITQIEFVRDSTQTITGNFYLFGA